MPLAHPGAALDPSQFVIAPHVAILDTFRMTNPDGSFAADITEAFLDRLIAHMAERELATGDLCPLVIGHTQNGLPETEQPPLVGYARNWHKGVLGNTGRPCAFFDAWVLTDKADLARQFPRRSAEVWASRYEIDPISLLGATTPARDLGMLKLNREGSFTYSPSSGDSHVPDEPKKNDDKPKGDPKETGAKKTEDGAWQQVLSVLTQIADKLGVGAINPEASAAGAPPADAGAGAPPEAGAPGAGGDDAEYEKLLQELMAGEPGNDASRAGEGKPTPNAGTTYPNGQASAVIPEPAKMSRENQELAQRVRDLEAQVTRGQVKDKLVKLSRPDIADPEDAALVEDLVAMPPDARQRQIDRFAKTPQAPGAVEAFHFSRALDNAVTNTGGRKRITTKEEQVRLQRQASLERKTFEQVASEAGYDLS